MTGATFKITHQNPDYYKEMSEAFGIKDADERKFGDNSEPHVGYKEVYFGREANTGRLYIAIKGNGKHAQIAQLDEGATKVLKAFLDENFRNKT